MIEKGPLVHKMTNKKKSNSDIRRVILYARQYRANQDVNETLVRLVDYLKAQGIASFIDIDTHLHLPLDLDILPREQMCKEHDLIIVVGGDGSILSAARMAVSVDLPVIGINRGRLGFLTDISPQQMEEQIAAVLMGQYQEEARFLLQTEIIKQENQETELALNDIVLSRGEDNRLVEFDVLVNQEFMGHYRCDGMIVSTPTGSTAYALSAGGPIMHPSLNALVLVPMFSHSLSSRPLVIDADADITFAISANNASSLRLSCDGHSSHELKAHDRISIKKHSHALRLLHPLSYHYYDTLRIKLGWETHHRG